MVRFFEDCLKYLVSSRYEQVIFVIVLHYFYIKLKNIYIYYFVYF